MSENGGFGVFMDEGVGLGCKREGVEKRMGTLGKSKPARERPEQERCTQREQLVHCTDLFPQVTLREQTEQVSIGPGLG